MKHVVAVVDGNDTHRNAVAQALRANYTANAYDDTVNAITGMHISRPKLVVVGQYVGNLTGVSFIRELRREATLADIPVVFIADQEDYRTRDMMRELGIKDVMVKPYLAGALLAVAERHINSAVIRSWQDLPPVHRKALEGSLAAFNAIANDLANGNPPSVGAVAESCAAVVDVVNKGDLNKLLSKIRNHDNFTYVHSLRMSAMLAAFSSTIGLGKAQQIQVASGGMLHDIGKMIIPSGLLNKQDTLNATEWKILRNHVATGMQILQSMDPVPVGVKIVVTQHHERIDGSGYPAGVRGDKLNDLARMAAIIDVFCALTDRRPYKRTMPGSAALEMMGTTMKGQLDMDLLLKFKEILLDTVSGEEEADVA